MQLVCHSSVFIVSLPLYWQVLYEIAYLSKPTSNNPNFIWCRIKFWWNFWLNWIIELFYFILICTHLVNVICAIHHLHSAVMAVCSCITLRANSFVPLFVWLRSASGLHSLQLLRLSSRRCKLHLRGVCLPNSTRSHMRSPINSRKVKRLKNRRRRGRKRRKSLSVIQT